MVMLPQKAQGANQKTSAFFSQKSETKGIKTWKSVYVMPLSDLLF